MKIVLIVIAFVSFITLGVFFTPSKYILIAKVAARSIFAPSQVKIIDDNVIVNTKLGQVRGQLVEPIFTEFEISKSNLSNPNQVYQFLAIPFAAPPIGKLRFKKPEPVRSWAPKILDGTKWSTICLQATKIMALDFPLPGKMSEDCLYLNIWSPKSSKLNLDKNQVKNQDLKPVYVFIHGGGFNTGTAVEMSGAAFASSQDIVYVSFNYRVGSLGFLNSPPGVKKELQAPGNVGLWDQLAALEWVRDHISNFGGNPNQVTIGGISAGAMSAGLLGHSPIVANKNLFSSLIMISGSPIMPGVIHEAGSMTYKSEMLAKFSGCPTDNSNAMMDCLMNIDGEKLMINDLQEIKKLFSNYSLINEIVAWAPVFGDEFLPQKISKLANEGNLKSDVRVLAGVTNFEGGIIRYTKSSENDMYQKFMSDNSIKHWIDTLVEYLFHVQNMSKLDSEMVSRLYFDRKFSEYLISDFEKELDIKVLDHILLDFLSDWYFNCPMVIEQQIFSRKNFQTIYQYENSYKTNNEFVNMFCSDKDLVCHGIDFWDIQGLTMLENQAYLFGFDDQDKKQAHQTINVLGQFIRGDKQLILNTNDSGAKIWHKYDLLDEAYIELNHEKNYPTKFKFRSKMCLQLSQYILSAK